MIWSSCFKPLSHKIFHRISFPPKTNAISPQKPPKEYLPDVHIHFIQINFCCLNTRIQQTMCALIWWKQSFFSTFSALCQLIPVACWCVHNYLNKIKKNVMLKHIRGLSTLTFSFLFNVNFILVFCRWAIIKMI